MIDESFVLEKVRALFLQFVKEHGALSPPVDPWKLKDLGRVLNIDYRRMVPEGVLTPVRGGFAIYLQSNFAGLQRKTARERLTLAPPHARHFYSFSECHGYRHPAWPTRWAPMCCCRIRFDATPSPDSESWSEASSKLRAAERIIAGSCTLFLSPTRVLRSAIVLKPSTLLHLHQVLAKRKYRMLFSPKHRRQPGPKGPNQELVDAGRNSDISGPFNAKASKKLKRRLGMIIVDGNENTLNGQVRTAAFTDTPATSVLRNSRLFIRQSIAQA